MVYLFVGYEKNAVSKQSNSKGRNEKLKLVMQKNI